MNHETSHQVPAGPEPGTYYEDPAHYPAVEAADMAGGTYVNFQTGEHGPDAGTAFGRPVMREEVDAYETRAQELASRNGYRRLGGGMPGPAPRPGVTMEDHVQHLKSLGYKW